MKMDDLRVIEFYSGIGGLHLALSRSKFPAKVVRAFDWDPIACSVYNANYGPTPVALKTDISTLTASDLTPMCAEIWLLSPACQPYTVLNPDAKGAFDPRAASFLHLIEHVLPDLVALDAHPRWLLVENVGGFETSSTRELLCGTLARLGYHTCELLLTPLQFGVPNSRLRYYLLARHEPFTIPERMETDSGRAWRYIPGRGTPWSDPRHGSNEEQVQNPVDRVKKYMDPSRSENGDDGDTYTIPDRVLEKWGRLFDIVLPSERRTCCFTRGYTKLVERAGSILQENEQLDTTETFNAFLAAQSAGDSHAVELLHPLRLRYFSPSELLRLFAFVRPGQDDSDFVWPEEVSTKVKYRLLGNSVNVTVVTELLNFLYGCP